MPHKHVEVEGPLQEIEQRRHDLLELLSPLAQTAEARGIIEQGILAWEAQGWAMFLHADQHADPSCPRCERFFEAVSPLGRDTLKEWERRDAESR